MFIQENAEDFFNAFKILRESNEGFTNGQDNSSRNSSSTTAFAALPAMGVDIVCLAFSAELYIKNLHYVITRETPRGHNIVKLFMSLSDEIQHEIYSHPSIAVYGWSFEDFNKQIEAISHGFEKWRYSHEYSTLRYDSYFALVFIEAVISATESERCRSAAMVPK